MLQSPIGLCPTGLFLFVKNNIFMIIVFFFAKTAFSIRLVIEGQNQFTHGQEARRPFSAQAAIYSQERERRLSARITAALRGREKYFVKNFAGLCQNHVFGTVSN